MSYASSLSSAGVANEISESEAADLRPPLGDPPIRVLAIDDEPALLRAVSRMLNGFGMTVTAADDGDTAMGYLQELEFDVVLVDLMMPRVGGLQVLDHVRANHPDIEVILMTAHGDIETAVKAVQSGAYDFIAKPFRSNDEVGQTIRKAAERRNLRARAEQLERRLTSTAPGLGGMVGSTRVMRDLFQRVSGVARTDVTVLILGESGTGKELTARAIHDLSARRDKAFIPVNCSTFPEGTIESELFGHEKGAFTSAVARRAGLFEAAHTGTIFLDELGDLPASAQVKLLRVLQDGVIKRVGATEGRQVDVRVIAATNVDLQKSIANGRFREDLFYRLNVVPITLPPLRERREDIPTLVYHFLKKHAAAQGKDVSGVAPEALELLCKQAWPGNVRELENSIERAVVFCRDLVQPADLGLTQPLAPVAVQSTSVGAVGLPKGLIQLPYREAKAQALSVFDSFYFTALREATQRNLSQAAKKAGLDRANFRRAVRRAGVRWREEE